MLYAAKIDRLFKLPTYLLTLEVGLAQFGKQATASVKCSGQGGRRESRSKILTAMRRTKHEVRHRSPEYASRRRMHQHAQLNLFSRTDMRSQVSGDRLPRSGHSGKSRVVPNLAHRSSQFP